MQLQLQMSTQRQLSTQHESVILLPFILGKCQTADGNAPNSGSFEGTLEAANLPTIHPLNLN